MVGYLAHTPVKIKIKNKNFMKKLRKKILIWIMMLSMVSMYGAYPAIPFAQAVDSLTSAKDTITDSDPGATATHTFNFTSTTTLASGDAIVIMIDEDNDDFSGISVGNVTCPANTNPTVSVNTVTCTATGAVAAGALTVTVADVVNPTAGNYRMSVKITDGGSVVYERAEPMVAIIDNVLMTANVKSTLNFTISGTTTAAVVNGAACDIDTSASSTLLDFGTLNVGASTTLCQQLTVETNASEGYSVVVYQDDEMRNSQGNTINSFDNSADGTGSTTPHAWTAPLGLIDQYDTYGHMGLTSDDSTLTANDFFGDELYVGFNGYGSTAAVEVMHHDGPADGFTVDKGLTTVAYTAQISALQEAGDYETTLTYIATPTY